MQPETKRRAWPHSGFSGESCEPGGHRFVTVVMGELGTYIEFTVSQKGVWNPELMCKALRREAEPRPSVSPDARVRAQVHPWTGSCSIGW